MTCIRQEQQIAAKRKRKLTALVRASLQPAFVGDLLEKKVCSQHPFSLFCGRLFLGGTIESH